MGLAHLETVLTELKSVGADIVAEGASLPYHLFQVHAEADFLPRAEEVVEDAESLHAVQFLTEGRKLRKVRGKVCAHAVEIAARFINVLDRNGNGDVAFLHDGVGNVRYLVEQHIVIFLAIPVILVALQRQQYGFLKRLLIHSLVADCYLCCRIAVERIEQFRIIKEHRGFIVF